jgi:hypothetical protein
VVDESEFGGGDLQWNMQHGGVRPGIDDVRAIYQTNPDDPNDVPDPTRVVRER